VGGRSVITLLTDFGTADSYVAEVKGVLLTRAPGAVLVDITHEVPPGDVRAAQVILDRTWRRFPRDTVHLCVVDPGVGTPRQAIALSSGGSRFVGPDNGLFTAMLSGSESAVLAVPAGAAPTFHGRDVFAPAAAALATGAPLSALGAPATSFIHTPLPAPRRDGSATVGEILLVDRFGNLITNVGSDAVPAGGRVHVAGADTGPVRQTFGDVRPGELVAYVGSGGTIEIALRDGSAADRLAATRGDEVRVLQA
jgi:S-adenosylmethionine hydrolase